MSTPEKTRVLPLTPERMGDFLSLHSEAHGMGWCFCVAWWVRSWEGWGDRSAEANRSLRESLMEGGQADGYLLYLGDAPIGWCQVGLRDRLPKLVAAYNRPADPTTWAISCLAIAPAHRGKGMAHLLLGGVVNQLQNQGAQRVEAYPRRATPDATSPLEPGEVWTGTVPLFEAAGFTLLRDHPTRPLFALELR